MALERYDIRADDTGTAYALPKTGPHIARPVRGGLYSLRSELPKIYRQKCGGNVPTQSALTDAIAGLEGDATDAAPVDFHLRVAKNDGALWLDLGDTTGRSVCITAAGWSVADTAPVWFRRTELTGALPEPVHGGDLDELWNLVNIDPQDRAVVLGILAATLFPNIPHPVAVLLAEHGSGKSTAGSTLAGLLDPSPVPLRKPPKDEAGWIIAAWGSHVVAVDNVSRIPEWWSDSLCRASTGDGDVRRRLYTDASLQVFAFRRVVWLTTIALEDMRDDLADRAVMLDLRKIGHRLTDHEMADTWRAAHPRLLGALLDLAVGVLRERPNVSTEDLPRMADFAQILRAVDAVLGTTGAARYAEMVDDIANDVASGNPILDALHIAARQTLPMLTSAELLGRIDAAWGPDRPRGKTWPRDARAMTAQLTRAKPTLERLDWSVVKHERGGHDRTVRWTVTPPARDAE